MTSLSNSELSVLGESVYRGRHARIGITQTDRLGHMWEPEEIRTCDRLRFHNAASNTEKISLDFRCLFTRELPCFF